MELEREPRSVQLRPVLFFLLLKIPAVRPYNTVFKSNILLNHTCICHIFWTGRPDSYFSKFEGAVARSGESKALNMNDDSIRVLAS